MLNNTTMMNKYIIPSVLALALVTAACDYNDENFEGLDQIATPTNVIAFDYTLTDADYASVAGYTTNKEMAKAAGVESTLAALKTAKAFSSALDVADYVPAFLAAKWFTADDGSAVKVTYNYNQGRATNLAGYESKVKTLTTADYLSVNSTVGMAKSFTPTYAAADHLPALIAQAYPNAVSGDICLAYFNTTTQEPIVGQTTLYEETFDSGVGTFQAITINGAKVWTASSYGSDAFMKMSGYQEINEDWLVSPQIDLAGQVDPVIKIRQTAKYVNGQWNQITIQVSTNYDGANVASATWTPLTITTKPTGSDYVFVDTEDIDLSAYAGQKIHVAFTYVSDLANAATWEVDNIKVLAKGLSASGVVEEGAFYQYSGSKWTSSSSAYALGKADYLSMGITSGNFSSTLVPNNYLPLFLAQKYPYAQEKDAKVVGYKYYSSTAKAVTYVADAYTFASGIWTKNSEVVIATDQFVRAGGVWKYDPSVVISLNPVKGNTTVSAYFQAVTDWVWENIDQAQLGITTKGKGYVSSYGNNDYYTGSSAYYNNVDIRPAKAREQYAAGYDGKTDDEIMALMTERFVDALGKALPKLHPDAVPVDGVDVTYTINIPIYKGDAVTACTHAIVYKVTAPGVFELVSGPTAIQ